MVQRLCNHKTGIHEVNIIVLEFEIRTVCRDKSNIDFVLGQCSTCSSNYLTLEQLNSVVC